MVLQPAFTHSRSSLLSASEAIELMASGGQFIDVRSPSEFLGNHVPQSANLPLITDSERDAVGRIYKRDGSKKAQEFGHWLVQGSIRNERIQSWAALAENPNVHGLFCARGGLRSEISQQWLSQKGIELPRVRGGYKAIRSELLRLLEKRPQGISLLVVTGKTGVGKTRALQSLHLSYPTIDLEGLAAHKGSAFGDVCGGQPAQGTFENSLALQMAKFLAPDSKRVLVEDESRRIGRIRLPAGFFQLLKDSSLIELELPIEDRVSILLEDYIEAQLTHHLAFYGFERALLLLEDSFQKNLFKLRKKLGGLRYVQLSQFISDAFLEQRMSHDSSSHRLWIEKLLCWYYDPLYERHLDRNRNRIEKTLSPRELPKYLGVVPELNVVPTTGSLFTSNTTISS